MHPVWWLVLAAIALRLLLFLGRGDYVAFDEGWYLLLGQSLLAGEGFALTGLRHVALSPLFPVLAGVVAWISDDMVWAGRIVAAITAGLLVLPAWSIFRRLAGRRTALLASGFVAILPSLAPFVAPYWVGWDLWVGAEPVLHLFLFTGLALGLRAFQRRRVVDWVLAGVAFSLAYLARPEAVIVAGLFGMTAGVAVLVRRDARGALGVALLGLAFLTVSAPYWLYLHDALGRWALTGRGVAVTLPTSEDRARSDGPKPARQIERMLWQGEHGQYIRTLFALDPSGTGLANTYWGVPRMDRPTLPPTESHTLDPLSTTDGGGAPAIPPAADDSVPQAAVAPPATEIAGPSAVEPTVGTGGAPRTMWSLYGKALAMVLPWYLWPFAALGLLVPGRRRRWRLESFAVGPLLATSLLVAVVVAVDPRTQLFLAPALAFYLARGIRVVGSWADRHRRMLRVHRGFILAITTAAILVSLLGVHARRLYMGTAVGSYHQLIGTENRRIGEELRRIVPPDQPVMSFHPGVALWARRDWRVLPVAEFGRIVRFAALSGCEYVVLSVLNPSPLEVEQMPSPFLILRVPPEAAAATGWRLDVIEKGEHWTLAWLRPA